MKVIISVALWGQRYAETFARYNLASQLSPDNIPRVNAEHQLTYHIITTRRDAKRLKGHPNFRRLAGCCEVVWDIIEDRGYNPWQIPADLDGEKYPFLSQLQNIGFERSLEHDVVVFNYADFIWADGALPRTIAMMRANVDAVLGFCPPVDSEKGKRALEEHRRQDADQSSFLMLPPGSAAGIIIDNLHAEARLRLWNGPDFTSLPTYVMWPVADEGLLVRAYHQTVLALRVKAHDPWYRGGIRRGSLDGYFTAGLADRGGIAHAADSEQMLVFSLYETAFNSGLRPGDSREESVRRCLRISVSEGQRRFAETPLLIKQRVTDAAEWAAVAQRSWEILSKFHEEVRPDWMAFAKEYATYGDIESLEQRWRKAWSLRVLLYRRVVGHGLVGRTASLGKRLFGPARARAWRVKLESWFFHEQPRV